MKRILAFAVILAFGFGCRALEDSKEDDEIKSNPPDDRSQDSNASSEKDDSEENENYISSDRDYSQDRRINGNRTRERHIYVPVNFLLSV